MYLEPSALFKTVRHVIQARWFFFARFECRTDVSPSAVNKVLEAPRGVGMNAALITGYGSADVIRIADVAKPPPGPGELVVKVEATSVNRTDCRQLIGGIARVAYGLWRPRRKTLGMDVAGVVEEVGPGTTGFRVGDRIFGLCPRGRDGAQAEYVCLPERRQSVVCLPTSLLSRAPICEGPFYASALVNGIPNPRPDSDILVFGASGAIGCAAVQLAKARGGPVVAAVEQRHLESLEASTPIRSSTALVQSLRFDVVYD